MKEQVESLGAQFVELRSGGRRRRGQGRLRQGHGRGVLPPAARAAGRRCWPQQNVVITTAAVPGKKAPVLVTARDGRARMAPGSVIVDLAAERGGNCELTRAGRDRGGRAASRSWARSTCPPPSRITPARCTRATSPPSCCTWCKDGELALDREDEIMRETLVTHGGEVVHARVRELLGWPPNLRSKREQRHAIEPGIGLYVFMLATFLGLGGDPPGVAAAAHAADVADQRHLGHLGGRRDPDRRRDRTPPRSASVLGFIAVAAAITNIVSGFLITDRMLKMFKKRRGRRSDATSCRQLRLHRRRARCSSCRSSG